MQQYIDLVGLIMLVVLQGLHVYHDYVKFKNHGEEIKLLKLRQKECEARCSETKEDNAE
jgi:hypothetical protein